MDPLLRFLEMGGYAQYVWPAYGIAAAVLGALCWHSWHRHRSSSAALARLPNGAEE
jgi:heme exporter protein D